LALIFPTPPSAGLRPLSFSKDAKQEKGLRINSFDAGGTSKKANDRKVRFSDIGPDLVEVCCRRKQTLPPKIPR